MPLGLGAVLNTERQQMGSVALHAPATFPDLPRYSISLFPLFAENEVEEDG